MTESEDARRDGEQTQASEVRTGARSRRLDSTELFAGGQEVEILHAGEIYRLRRTRSGKLILTK